MVNCRFATNEVHGGVDWDPIAPGFHTGVGAFGGAICLLGSSLTNGNSEFIANTGSTPGNPNFTIASPVGAEPSILTPVHRRSSAAHSHPIISVAVTFPRKIRCPAMAREARCTMPANCGWPTADLVLHGRWWRRWKPGWKWRRRRDL